MEKDAEPFLLRCFLPLRTVRRPQRIPVFQGGGEGGEEV